MDIYEGNGYEDRNHYLEELALDYGLDFDSVYFLAQMLGEEDDFDGLIIAIESFLMPTY
jgi:hypothetical protein